MLTQACLLICIQLLSDLQRPRKRGFFSALNLLSIVEIFKNVNMESIIPFHINRSLPNHIEVSLMQFTGKCHSCSVQFDSFGQFHWLTRPSGVNSANAGGVDSALQPDDQPACETTAQRSPPWSGSHREGRRCIFNFSFSFLTFVAFTYRGVPAAGMQGWLNIVEQNLGDQVFPRFHEKILLCKLWSIPIVLQSSQIFLKGVAVIKSNQK